MSAESPSHTPDPAIREFIRSSLRKISSTFGRLTQVASMRDPASGSYRHPGAPQDLDPRGLDDGLRSTHVEVFEEWLCLSLQEQASDIATYLSESRDLSATVRDWKQQLSYVGLIPAKALDTQQKLFCSDMEMVLNVFYRNA